MTWILLRLAAVWVVYEVLRFFLVRGIRNRWQAGAERFVRRHKIQMESARFIDRVWVRERLAQDATIEEKVVTISRETGRTLTALRRQVDTYVDEIAPVFSMSAYYRFGTSVAKRIIDFMFEVVVPEGGFERQMEGVPAEAVRVYVINHRANMDPLVLAYGLLRHVPMSYAVGEWALVWPLDWLFRRFGSYFVRRGEKDPLYHVVLERFVQLIAGQGAVTGFFIEGGLSRDGALRKPRTGLLRYIIGLRHEQPDREIVFMPVGLNYDRVLEDRILTAEKDGPLPRPGVSQRLVNLAALCFWVPMLVFANGYKVASGSHRKFGYAAVSFGEPLRLLDWPGGATIHELQGDAREVAYEALGEELLYRRVARVVPATPVPIFAAAFLRDGPDDNLAVQGRIRDVVHELRAVDAPVALGRAFHSIEARRQQPVVPSIVEGLDDDLLDAEEAEQILLLATLALQRRRVLKEAVMPAGRGFEVLEGSEDVLRYYALSIQHHLGPR